MTKFFLSAVLCHTATSSREGLFFLHSLSLGKPKKLKPEAMTFVSTSSGGSGQHQPEARGASTVAASNQHLHGSHHRGNGCHCHPDDERKLVLLAFANHWNFQLIAFMKLLSCGWGSVVTPSLQTGAKESPLWQKPGLFKQPGLYQLNSFKS